MTHDTIREQLTLMALGEPAEHLSAVLHHVAHCQECRAFARDVDLVLARLPEALPQAPPPPALREQLMRRLKEPAVTLTRSRETRPADLRAPETQGLERRPDTRRETWWARLAGALLKPAVRLAAVVAVLLAINVALLWDSIAQRREIAALSQLYTEEISWLRTAENLLAAETPPAARASLVPPTNGEGPGGVTPQDGAAAPSGSTAPIGVAALYPAYDNVSYLIVKARGLGPGTAYEVWLRDGGEPQMLGIFITSALGDGTLVHRSQGLLPTGASLGVRPVGGAGPALTGTLEPAATGPSRSREAPEAPW